jgi:hypothetical protein
VPNPYRAPQADVGNDVPARGRRGDRIGRGRLIVTAVFGVPLTLDVGGLLFMSLQPIVLVRTSLAMVLCYFLYRGKDWARVILLIIYALGAAYLASVALGQPLNRFTVVVWTTVLLNTAIVLALGTSRSVMAFLIAQRDRRADDA